MHSFTQMLSPDANANPPLSVLLLEESEKTIKLEADGKCEGGA